MKPDHRPSRMFAPAMLAGLLALGGPAALAQSEGDGSGDESFPEALDNLPGRVEEAMRGLLDRMKPTIEDAFELMDVLGEIDSPKHYEKPAILPNGDILIRRSPDAPEWDPEVDDLDDGPRPRHLDPNEGTPI
ncbi:MAG TPA: hypothetical protein VMM55_13660 [Thermohalobaculum sp.]|nr:hypothetical protein [Thermohalobaculum sp.]